MRGDDPASLQEASIASIVSRLLTTCHEEFPENNEMDG